jgi:hypothetical protein
LLGVLFDTLLERHRDATKAERTILEPLIFTKSVDYRRDVKRRRISPDATTDGLLTEYKERVKK